MSTEETAGPAFDDDEPEAQDVIIELLASANVYLEESVRQQEQMLGWLRVLGILAIAGAAYILTSLVVLWWPG